MSQIDSIVLVALLIVAVYRDLVTRRIPNVLIAVGLAIGLAFAFVRGNLAGSAIGFGTGLLVFLPFFALRLVGAGDVKLMTIVGAFTGAPALVPITLYTCIAGGLLGLISVVAARSGSQAMQNLRLVLFAVSAHTAGAGVPVADLGLKSAARIPYAVAIASGVVVWMLIGGRPS